MTNRVIPVLEPTAIDSRLEYSIAFDLAAARVAESNSIASGVALVASSPIFVREWLPRATGSFTIIAESSSVASVARRMVDYGTTPPRNVAAVVQAESASELAESQLSAAVWASPRPGTWRSLFAILDATLVSGASIVVLTAGRLSPLVGGIRRGLTPGEPRLPIRGLDREIEYRGYRLENV